MGKSDSSPETTVIVNCVINAPLILLSITGNTLVVAAILRTPSLRSPSTILLSSLAVSDILVGLFVQPLWISYELTKNRSLYQAVNALAFFVCGVSLSTMTAISVDRFLALHYHMRYPNLMTTQRALYATAMLWLVSFFLSFTPYLNMNVYFLTAAISIVICLILSTVCYVRIFRIVRQHQLQIHVQQQAVEHLNTENNQNMQRSKKSATNTLIYYIVMLLCYSPLFISMITSGIPHIHLPKWWTLANNVVFLNSSINPFLYCWRLRGLRAAVVKTARQVLCKETEEN